MQIKIIDAIVNELIIHYFEIMKIYKKYTNQPFYFLFCNTTPSSNHYFCFRKNLTEKLKMIDDEIKFKKKVVILI